jgi:hypothetical protein
MSNFKVQMPNKIQSSNGSPPNCFTICEPMGICNPPLALLWQSRYDSKPRGDGRFAKAQIWDFFHLMSFDI